MLQRGSKSRPWSAVDGEVGSTQDQLRDQLPKQAGEGGLDFGDGIGDVANPNQAAAR